MNARQFYDLVVRMRQKQKDYFRSRTSTDLRLSKELERQVDAEIERAQKLIGAPPRIEQMELFNPQNQQQ